MSLKKVGQVKADRGFKIWDLLVYGIIILIAAVLFVVVFTTRDTSPLTGIRIYSANDVVFEYNFVKSEYTVLDETCVEVTDDGEEFLLITLRFDGGGYNCVEIDKRGSVKVTSADCGKKDCTYSPEIKDNSGMIYCLPHRLKILPYGFDVDGGVIKI